MTGLDRTHSKRNYGVTLVELLLVVAIMAVLALVALPSLLEASTRAKVSRAKADLKALVVGVETYHVDEGRYPDAIVGRWKAGILYSAACLSRVSTPVAYLQTTTLPDPFTRRFPLLYVNIRAQVEESPSIIDVLAPGLSVTEKEMLTRHEYVVLSTGPDGVLHNELESDEVLIHNLVTRSDLSSEYDSSNGTVSGGDITRTAIGPW